MNRIIIILFFLSFISIVVGFCINNKKKIKNLAKKALNKKKSKSQEKKEKLVQLETFKDNSKELVVSGFVVGMLLLPDRC